MTTLETEIERQQEVRDAILDAAERLLIHYGYQKMTMQDLAQEAGIGVGTTYLHFKGKADVAHGVIERANVRVVEYLSRIADSDEPVEERLHQMLVARILLRYEGARKAKHRLEEMIAVIRPIFRDGKARWLEAEPRVFAKILHEGQSQGAFAWNPTIGDASETAHMILLATCGMMPDKLSPADFDNPEEVRLRAERLATLLLGALRPL